MWSHWMFFFLHSWTVICGFQFFYQQSSSVCSAHYKKETTHTLRYLLRVISYQVLANQLFYSNFHYLRGSKSRNRFLASINIEIMYIFSDGNAVFTLFFIPLNSEENFHICYFEGFFSEKKSKSLSCFRFSNPIVIRFTRNFLLILVACLQMP